MKTNIDLKRPASFRRPAAALTALIALAALIATACVTDTHGEDPRTTTFTLTLPEAQTVATRSAGTAIENTIRSLSLIITDANGGNVVSNIDCTASLTSSDPSGNRWTFRASVPFGTAYDLLLVANASTSSISAGQNRATLEANLRQTKTEGTEWSVTGADAATSIPMLGELRNKTFSGTYIPEPIPLRRMLARVNVTLAPAAQTSFRLTGVYVNNYNLGGNLYTDYASYNPTMPHTTGVSSAAATSYLEWLSPTNATKSENQIYIFERARGVRYPAAGWVDAPCIIVRGSYNGAADSYYRLDFVSGVTSLDIVRNHSYNFTISSVSGPGYSSTAAARAAAPANMSADVIAWNDADLSGIDVGGTIHTVSTSATNGSVVANYIRAYAGMTIRVAAVPATGYRFAGWTTTPATSINGSTTNPAEFTIAENTTVTPTFAKSDGKFPVGASVNPANGGHAVAVTNQGSVISITEATAGAGVSFTATPAPGQVFKRWNISGPAPYGFDPTANPLHVRMPEWPLTLEGFFGGENEHIFFVQANFSDAPNTPIVQPASAATAAAVVITAPAPRTGYRFMGWELTGGLTLRSGTNLTPASITVNMPAHDNGVATALYSNINASVPSGGFGAVAVTARGGATPITTATTGQEVTFTATPPAATADRLVFCGWTITAGTTPIDFDPMANPLTITMPDGPLNLTARYDSGQILIVRNPGTEEAYLDLGVWPDDFSTDPASDDYYLKKIAYFKWGSVVVVNNDDRYTAFDSDPTVENNAVMFNPSEATFSTYADIPYESADAPDPEVATPAYTSRDNVLAGKGDPCRLVGLTVAQIRAASNDDEWAALMSNSEWRLPTHSENLIFVGTSISYDPTISNPYVSIPPGPWIPSSPGSMTFKMSGNTVLPAAGRRNSLGIAVDVGHDGRYWSSTKSALDPRTMLFHALGVLTDRTFSAPQSLTTRCVPQE